jgi:hypothetical protein
MALNLMLLDEKRFEELCQALLHEEFPRFRAFSPPDGGMDGYDADSETIFQAYFPEREPRTDKIREDLEKTRSHGWPCKRWVLLLPKNPSLKLANWIRKEEQPQWVFEIVVWGKTEIHALLRKHKEVKEQFFPSEVQEVVKRYAKGKGPREGDAEPGQEISAAEAEELRQTIVELAEDEAKRKKRPAKDSDFQREYGEFNAHFKLSSYGRLPREKLTAARTYLDDKLYARRDREPVRLKRNRMVGGIKFIAKSLGIGDTRYRQLLVELTGKRSTREMDMKELKKVFDRFRHLQGQAEALG